MLLEIVGAQPEHRKSLGPLTATFARGVTVLLGPNGTGKTTALRCIAQQHPVSAGEYFLATEQGREELLSHRVSFLPQDPSLPERFTVSQLLDYAGHLRKVSAKEIRSVIDELDLRELLKKKAGQLSGGQKQTVCLGIALCAKPAVLLLDEPTTGLDPDRRELLLEKIREISQNAIVILSTHLSDDVLFGEQIVLMHRGSAIFSGSLKEFAGPDPRPADITNSYRKYLGVGK